MQIVQRMRKIREKGWKQQLKSNKGFSLVELLIVIAIMGVIAVIAFNMFGGVLGNTKKRADEQMAKKIESGILTYCIDSGDWNLSGAFTNAAGTTAANLSTKKPLELIQTLMDPVYDSTGKEYGPYFTKKDPEVAASEEVNLKPYKPQWLDGKGGEFVGWSITVYGKSQTVVCNPLKKASGVTAEVKVASKDQ